MPLPPDERFILKDYSRRERDDGWNFSSCVLYATALLVLAFLITLALYACEVLS